jgi:hypothetical protein
MGKVIGQSRKEIEKRLDCRYYADNTASLLADEMIATEASKAMSLLNQLEWCGNAMEFSVLSGNSAVPALMAGNTESQNMHQTYKVVH